MTNDLKLLSEFIASTRYEDLPSEVLEQAKWVLRDSIGVIVAGMREPEVNSLAEFASTHAPGKASLFGMAGKVRPEWASMVHGTAGTSLEMDEGHAFARGHASVHALPPALALAESLGKDGKDCITAIVVGYEAAARAGIATQLRKGVHPFGVWGVLGAAAVTAKFQGLTASEIAGILELAASYPISPSFKSAYQGANVRNTFAGMVNMSGMLAAEFYQLGFRGQRGALETSFGQILGDSFEPSVLSEKLGDRYEIMRGYFKPYSACRYAHAAIDALFGLDSYSEIDVNSIRSIQVATYDIAAKLKEPNPETPLAGRFSIPHVIAATLVLGNAGPDAFNLKALKNPQIHALAGLVDVIEDPEFTKITPAQRPAKVTINFGDGSKIDNTVFGSKGDPDQPMSEGELRDKYDNLTQASLGDKKAANVWNLIGEFEKLSDFADLTNNLVSTKI